jgi:mercuric ion transport protein
MATPDPERRIPTKGVVIGAFALVLCCAGPALIAGGVLSAIGAAVCNPIVIAFGVVLIATAVALTLRRRRRRCSPIGDGLPAASSNPERRSRS